jgi:hypothetical protein
MRSFRLTVSCEALARIHTSHAAWISADFSLLKTDIALLDREIKGRKQQFGVVIVSFCRAEAGRSAALESSKKKCAHALSSTCVQYDLMEELEANTALTTEEKESRIRAAFDAARKDIAVIQAKRECKREEISVLEAEADHAMVSEIPPSSGTVINNAHPSMGK